jgi:putative phage-type endonuclease
MEFTIFDVEQNTPEWHSLRCGNITGSEFGKVTTPSTKKLSTSHVALVNTKIAEKLTGKQEETFKSKAMEIGSEREDDALELLNFISDYNFEKVGFIKSNLMDIGCSLDAFSPGRVTTCEIKCPNASTHVSYKLSGKVPNVYIPQIQGGLMITGFEKCVFMSYHPDMEPFIITVYRDEIYIAELKRHLHFCVEKIEEGYKKLQGE